MYFSITNQHLWWSYEAFVQYQQNAGSSHYVGWHFGCPVETQNKRNKYIMFRKMMLLLVWNDNFCLMCLCNDNKAWRLSQKLDFWPLSFSGDGSYWIKNYTFYIWVTHTCRKWIPSRNGLNLCRPLPLLLPPQNPL